MDSNGALLCLVYFDHEVYRWTDKTDEDPVLTWPRWNVKTLESWPMKVVNFSLVGCLIQKIE